MIQYENSLTEEKWTGKVPHLRQPHLGGLAEEIIGP